MINSVNTLEFLKPKLINMDKFNSSSTTSRIHHPISHTPTRSFYTFVTNSSESVNPTLMIASDHQVHLQHQQSSLRQERVKVQHLENHTKLQNNNCWSNFRTLISASPCAIVGDSDAVCQDILRPDREYELEVDDMQHLQNRSAFTLELKNNNIYSNICNNNNNIIRKMTKEDCQSESLSPIETNNNHLFYKHHQKNGFINKQQPQPKTMMVILPRRTEDQEHAYRRIESVHNYAKLKSYDDEVADTQSPNGSRHSSNYLDDEEEEDDDEEEDDEEDDYNNDADYDVEEDEMIDLDGDYEDIFNRRRYPKLSTSSADGGAIISPKLATKKSHYKCMTSQQKSQSSHKNTDDGTDLHIDIDVETVENPITNTMAMINSNDSATVKPDHHARRPMNAFLIFCKRHRAIVKERYKTLENR